MDAFYPGRVWRDTAGRRIQAHGGSVFFENGTYNWYGEDKSLTDGSAECWHNGVRCYSSRDLYNWEDLGTIIPPEEDERSSLHPRSKMDRPHILFNARTKKYVCWLKIMNADNTQSFTVLTADRLLGPYTKVCERLYACGMNCGDFDLAAAPDGKAYVYFERVHSETICADLTDDYCGVTGYYSTHFPHHEGPPFVREATAHFVRGGRHYLITSGTTGYRPNPSEAAVADTWHGPFTVLGDPHVGDASRTSFHSQISSVFRVQGTDLFIAMADRWIPAEAHLPYREEDYTGDIRTRFGRLLAAAGIDPQKEPERARAYAAEHLHSDERVNTSVADYVWLPVEFEGETPRSRWYDSWRIQDFVSERRTSG